MGFGLTGIGLLGMNGQWVGSNGYRFNRLMGMGIGFGDKGLKG